MKKRFDRVVRIYALTDVEGNIFYIGCTVQPLEIRMAMHLCEARKNWTYTNVLKNNKIRSLNYNVFIVALNSIIVFGKDAYTAQKQGSELEKNWIKTCLELGYELCNRQHGNTDYTKGSKKRMKSETKLIAA